MHTERALSILQVDPTARWTPAAMSVQMRVPPATAGAALRRLYGKGRIHRDDDGLYMLQGAPAPPVVPVLSGKRAQRPVTDLERELLTGVLRRHGRPMSSAMLAGRLRNSGFGLERTDHVIEACLTAGTITRLDDGRVSA
ncbi:hypothetical protein GCM10008961_31980 [Deinococcus knuensis]|uniref:HTH HARE-type domain-containing protein n=2 Tax=Deinococcus knuensis TaxID=1837380 RepID=A0ABQ2SRT6_9DEIO|nr:hypothetical protein GCM10008961_31980 [Deinococcus knuensis]